MNATFRIVHPLVLALVVAAALGSLALFVRPDRSEATTGIPGTSSEITGWAWSDTVGWVSLNCSNLNECGTSNYGLVIDADGNLSGYGWSENIGWVSANASDLIGCPSTPCTARMESSTMKGWLKALSANDSQSGGWDGFIKLSDTGYGPTLSGEIFSGFSWGSMVVGWVDWALARTEFTPCVSQNICSGDTVIDSCTSEVVQSCTSGTICSAGACVVPPPPSASAFGSFTGHLTVKPALVHAGEKTRVYWNISEVIDSTCSVTGSNGDSWTGLAFSGTSGKQTSAIISQTIYTLTCTGVDNSTFSETATANIIPVFQEQ